MNIHSSAVIYPKVSLEEGVRIGANTVVGAYPLMLEFKGRQRVRQEFTGEVVIEDDVDIGANCVIVGGVVGSTIIRRGVFIAHGSIIGHDCDIGEGTVISTNVTLNGHVEVGTYSFIASNTVIPPKIKIGSLTMIGMGSVVTKDVPDKVIAYGSPCRVIRDNLWRPPK